MSGRPTATGPSPAYLEEVNEESQTTIPGSKQTANTGAKRSKDTKKARRDAASDSGYSSHTAATAGSSSHESKNASSSQNSLTRFTRKMASAVRKSQGKEPSSPPKTTVKKSITRAPKKDNLRDVAPACESREDAAKIRLSGAPVQPARTNAVHQQPARAKEAPSPPKPQVAPQAPARPMPIQHPAAVRVRTAPPGLRPPLRPQSYHAGAAPMPHYMQAPPQVYQQRPVPVPLSLPTASYPPPYHGPSITYVPSPLQTSPNRQIPYHFPPTAPPHHIPPPQWHPEGFYAPASHSLYASTPLMRRYSVQTAPLLGQYPSVPPAHNAPMQPHPDPYGRRLSVSSIDQHSVMSSPLEDEAVYLEEDSEAYYRRMMPPPPVPPVRRPPMQHSASTSATIRKRDHRNSVDLSSHSPSRQSIEESRPSSRPSVSSRASSTKHVSRVTEAPPSPTTVRRRSNRPVSYHEGGDPYKQAEEYQAIQKGATGQVDLTAEAIKQVNKAGHLVKVKSKSKGGSETGSRASSSREGSDAKQRKSLERYHSSMLRLQIAQGTNVEVKGEGIEGQTIRLRQSPDGDGGMEMSIGGAERVKYRDSRPKDRARSSTSERRYSISTRHGVRTVKDEAEPRPQSHRRSSSRPVTRRESRDDSHKEHEQRLRNLRAEAARHKEELPIEDEEEEAGARQIKDVDTDRADRLQKLRTGSHSRRSSKSTVGRRRIAVVPTPVPADGEGKPF